MKKFLAGKVHTAALPAFCCALSLLTLVSCTHKKPVSTAESSRSVLTAEQTADSPVPAAALPGTDIFSVGSIWKTGNEETASPKVVIEPAKYSTLSAYDYSAPVALCDAVGDDYFSDAAFVGDSRTDGFRLYSGLNTPTYFSAKNISVVNIGTEKVIPNGSGGFETIFEALSRKQFGKVYVMLGINEIALTNDSFGVHYSAVIDEIRRLQPNAVIYLQAILPVSEEKENEGTVFNNTNIAAFNEVISLLAVRQKVYYLDTYAAVADENGFLPPDASYDGIHLIGDYCKQWCQYLRTHTVDPRDFAQAVGAEKN